MGRVTTRMVVQRIEPSGRRRSFDQVAVEEPLEIRVDGQALAVTMRTPGHDIELIHGFLFAEGIIADVADIATARYCAGAVSQTSGFGLDSLALAEPVSVNTYNVLDVRLADGVAPLELSASRNFITSSACGVCGKASLDALRQRGAFDVAADPLVVPSAVLTSLPEELRRSQPAFDRTGGVHAAGLFTAEGTLLVAREDVGRHNAVDKVIGWALLQRRLPLAGIVLQVSSRASFELTQKAYLAGVPMLSAVSAPSSLAVDLAVEFGMTLAGFVRGGSANLYSRPDRVS
ncbi:MAG: formate dehydrogenase accessory sulfurtransferase FdhD [Micropruina sp.]